MKSDTDFRSLGGVHYETCYRYYVLCRVFQSLHVGWSVAFALADPLLGDLRIAHRHLLTLTGYLGRDLCTSTEIDVFASLGTLLYVCISTPASRASNQTEITEQTCSPQIVGRMQPSGASPTHISRPLEISRLLSCFPSWAIVLPLLCAPNKPAGFTNPFGLELCTCSDVGNPWSA
jgi:hypothetical protein